MGSELHPTRTGQRRAPYILSSGMNAGLANLWVWHGFLQFGTPLELVHFEYDTSIPLAGSDTIGVCLRYADQRVYYVHSLANREGTSTNATCAQVAMGADAAMHALFAERLASRFYFASALYGV